MAETKIINISCDQLYDLLKEGGIFCGKFLIQTVGVRLPQGKFKIIYISKEGVIKLLQSNTHREGDYRINVKK